MWPEKANVLFFKEFSFRTLFSLPPPGTSILYATVEQTLPYAESSIGWNCACFVYNHIHFHKV